MPTPLKRLTASRRPIMVAAALVATAAFALVAAPFASANKSQLSIIQDSTFLSSPATSLPTARALGDKVVRVSMSWYAMAPQADAKKKPSVNLSSPSAYPASAWAQYDNLVRSARAQGLQVAIQVTGGAPKWATGANPPAKYRADPKLFGWRPNAKLYGQFVHAVSQRYSGHFKPSGASSALPAIRFWSFWNEPNFGTDLGPQTTSGSQVPVGPTMYRGLLAAAWKAVHQTGHGRDTLLFGELDPLGSGLAKPGHHSGYPGVQGVLGGTAFVRALYCVDTNYRPLTGSIARKWGCPTTSAASHKFRSSNPALFSSKGFAIHPYTMKGSPTNTKVNNNYVTFPVLSRLTTALDRSTGAYHSGKHFPLYNDEFGFITHPPSAAGFASPAKASVWLYQSEYLSYKNPRIATYDQYLIGDPPLIPGRAAPGFNTGLYTSSGKPKATLNAYRLPVWMPKQTVRKGAKAEIWGGARPSTFAGAGARKVSIQIQKGGHGAWTTLQTVKTSARTGYFDVRPKLPYSGNLRLSYTYPSSQSLLPVNVAGSTIIGRTLKVKVTG
jgi:hypothetical protein